jgi:hypothetical protein
MFTHSLPLYAFLFVSFLSNPIYLTFIYIFSPWFTLSLPLYDFLLVSCLSNPIYEADGVATTVQPAGADGDPGRLLTGQPLHHGALRLRPGVPHQPGTRHTGGSRRCPSPLSH